ncbi:MAG: LOG family protein [Deltaproteobacteria bacterium]|nr:LOG family protein [Deltaproteobacteria bacterium]
MNAQLIVSVFGGSRCGPESEEYQEGVELGRRLAEAGYAVCTGGYAGVMEAVSRGAHERHGDVIGVTMDQFDLAPNRFVKRVLPSANFYERLQGLVRQSCAYVAVRGGMGTLTELCLVWNKLYMRVIEPRPLILLGRCWPPIIEAWRQHLVVSDEDCRLLAFAATPAEAVQLIRTLQSPPPR